MVDQGDVGGIIQTAAHRQQPGLGEYIFSVFVTGLGQQNLIVFLVHAIVARAFCLGFPGLAHQLWHQLIDAHINIHVIFGLAGNNQRGTRLVDQDRVHFVNDGVVERALETFADLRRHVVAQIIETEFVVGSVGNVGGVSGLFVG